MAAIVSQLAAANRRRKANKKNHVSIDKSVYVLPPFDPCFKPEVHNRYIRHKQAHLAHQEFMERIGEVSPVHIHQLEEPGSILTKPDQGRQERRREPERVQHPDLVIRVLKVTKQWWPLEAEMEALISRISLTFFPTRIQDYSPLRESK